MGLGYQEANDTYDYAIWTSSMAISHSDKGEELLMKSTCHCTQIKFWRAKIRNGIVWNWYKSFISSLSLSPIFNIALHVSYIYICQQFVYKNTMDSA